MRDFIYQTNVNECGFASLKMMLTHLTKDERYLYLVPTKKNNEMYSLYDLKNIAYQYGLNLEGYFINNQNDFLTINTPFIYVYQLKDGNKHAVFVKKIGKFISKIYDPSLGRHYYLNKKIIKEITSGVEILKIVDFHLINNEKLHTPKLIERKTFIKIYTLEILAILAYFLSAYYVDQESYFLYPIIFIVIGVLLAIFYKLSIYKAMKQFDEQFIHYTFDENSNKREDNYRLMHATKSGLLSTTSNMIITLISALAINVILIANNLYALFVLITCLFLVLFDTIFILPSVKKKMVILEHDERKLFLNNKLTKIQYLNNYGLVKNKTYKIARLIDLKKIVMYFLLLVMVLLMSAITNNANIFFVLFYLAMSLFTYMSFDNVTNMIFKNKEIAINQTKFYTLINEKTQKTSK